MMPDDYTKATYELQDRFVDCNRFELDSKSCKFFAKICGGFDNNNNTPTPEDRRAKFVFRENSEKY